MESKIIRSEREVQDAHDMFAMNCLHPETLGNALNPMQWLRAEAYADAMCWLLGHEHSDEFGDLLKLVTEEMERAGVEIVEFEKPMTIEEARAEFRKEKE